MGFQEKGREYRQMLQVFHSSHGRWGKVLFPADGSVFWAMFYMMSGVAADCFQKNAVSGGVIIGFGIGEKPAAVIHRDASFQ